MKIVVQLQRLTLSLGFSLAMIGVQSGFNQRSMANLPEESRPIFDPALSGPTSPNSALPASAQPLPLSPGDRIKLLVQDGDLFNGIYEIDLNGDLQLPYLAAISVAGLDLPAVEQLIQARLIQARLFQPGYARVSIGIVQWAAVEVNVSGAVFQPGLLTINSRSVEAQALQTNFASGDSTSERSLAAALRAAGGITPRANVKEITVIRNGQERKFDLSGIFVGEPVENIPLIRGDRVVVPELAASQNQLVRPSAITLPAIQIRISNLTVPANSNSSSSLNREAITFPYGSRFTAAVISANCVGGTKAANARRKAILVRTDRATGVTTVYEQGIETLIRSATDQTNPFLMPDDGVACYDSTVTEIRDVARTLLDVITPINIIQTILGW